MKQTLACGMLEHDRCPGDTRTNDPPLDAEFPPEPCACVCHLEWGAITGDEPQSIHLTRPD